MRSHRRLLIVLFLCLVLIGFFGASAMAAPRTASWVDSLLPGAHFTLFSKDKKEKSQSQLTTIASNKTLRYAAMGDSIAAGAGLLGRVNENAIDIGCGRSRQSYPELLAKKLNAKLTFAACGGATTENFTQKQTTSKGINNSPQLETVFKNGKPDIITMTIGANDMLWVQTIGGCYSSTCDTLENTHKVDSDLEAYRVRLVTDLRDISNRSHGSPPTVLLTSYFNFGSPACLSSIAPGAITPDEVTWFNEQNDKLNGEMISVASQYKNVKYVPVDTSDHGFCAPKNDRWIQNLGEPAPFHLTAKGEQAYADAIYKYL